MHEELISAVNAKGTHLRYSIFSKQIDGPLLHWSFPAEGRLKKVVELALDDHQEWLEMGRKQKVSQTRTVTDTICFNIHSLIVEPYGNSYKFSLLWAVQVGCEEARNQRFHHDGALSLSLCKYRRFLGA